MLFWEITEDDGAFRIAGQRKESDGMWRDDPRSTVDDVIARMIAILQAATHQ